MRPENWPSMLIVAAMAAVAWKANRTGSGLVLAAAVVATVVLVLVFVAHPPVGP